MNFLKKIFSFSKKKKDLLIKKRAIIDLSNLLTNYGFSPEEALKVAREFWDKNEKKLKEVM
jgi:hypothetical protein